MFEEKFWQVVEGGMWLIGTALLAKVVNNLFYELLNEPNSGVNLFAAIVPALMASIVMAFGVYMAFFNKRKSQLKVPTVQKPHPINSANQKLKVTMEDAYSNFNSPSQLQQSEAKQIDERKLWELALAEYESNKRDNGLWAKCFAEADGDENKAKANYLKQRVIDLKSEKIKEQSNIPSENLSSIVNNNPSKIVQTTISCPMCHTTNLRTRDDCVSCKYNLRALKRLF